MKIKAALFHDAQTPPRIDEVDIDDPRDDEILVRLVGSGICHTDLVIGQLWSLFPGNAGRVPVVFGHEGAGVVEAVGAGVKRIKPGDHVVLSYRSCRRCRSCEGGRPYYCAEFRGLNAMGSRPDGSTTMSAGGSPVYGSFFGQSSFATHVISYESNAVVVGSDMDLTIAAPFGCGIQTGAGSVLNTLKTREGDSVAIFGAGGVGLSAVMAAKVAGAGVIAVVEPLAHRRQAALDVGATHVIDPAQGDPVAAIRDATSGGAVGSIETSARKEVVVQAIQCLAPMGTCIALGVGTPPFSFDMQLLSEGKRLTSTIEGEAVPQEFLPRLLDLYRSGKLPVDKLIKRYPFAELGAALADASSGAVIKPVLVF